MTTLRPFNTYGPRQSQRAIIPTIITQALAGDVISLGNVDPVRDLTYVTDTATAFLDAAGSPKTIGEVINLGVGHGTSVRELVEQIGKILKRELKIEIESPRVRPETSEVMRLVSDNQKASTMMGWKPKVDLETGLAATVRTHPKASRILQRPRLRGLKKNADILQS